MSYGKRATLCTHPLSKRLFEIMETKKTNLALSADVISPEDLIRFADLIGPYICVLKTHIDILDHFEPSITLRLKELAEKHNFLIFEDRKFADIGHTVAHQYQGGVFRIADWAHITNAHALPGPGVIEGLKRIGLPKGNGLLILAQMSAKDNLFNENYILSAVKLALLHKDFVIGLITQNKLIDDPAYIHFTPGIQMSVGNDAWGQQYVTPQNAILDRGNDVIIVGRGILGASNPREAAQRYQQVAWDAYEQRIKA
jgi:orotidine 5'-phosphate decarboxylase subfamily 1